MLEPRFKYGTPSPLMVASPTTGLYVPAMDEPCCCCECTVNNYDDSICLQCSDSAYGSISQMSGVNVTLAGSDTVLPMNISTGSGSITSPPCTPTAPGAVAGTYVFTRVKADCNIGTHYDVFSPASYVFDTTGCAATGPGGVTQAIYRLVIQPVIDRGTGTFRVEVTTQLYWLNSSGAVVATEASTVCKGDYYKAFTLVDQWKWVPSGLCRSTCNDVRPMILCGQSLSGFTRSNLGVVGPASTANGWNVFGITVSATFF